MYSNDNYQFDPQDGGPSTDIATDQAGLVKGQNFSLHYDDGDEWMFAIQVQKVEEETAKEPPRLLKPAGHVEQYPDWEDEGEI